MSDTKQATKLTYEYMGTNIDEDRVYRIYRGNEVWGETYTEHHAKDICGCVNAHAQLYEALRNALPFIDRFRHLSGGDGDIAALNARAALKLGVVAPETPTAPKKVK